MTAINKSNNNIVLQVLYDTTIFVAGTFGQFYLKLLEDLHSSYKKLRIKLIE